MSAPAPFVFEKNYASLPERFFARCAPTPVRAPRLLHLNRALADALALDVAWLESEAGVAALAGNVVVESAAPLAMAYAGHQFGHFVPRLGDGRAILLGEVRDKSGALVDVHLKGAGRTPFSRGGDGRAWLGPALREFLVSEAIHALGVPTTRVLAVLATGEQVLREGPRPGGLVVRTAKSHVRVGTFEYFAARGDDDGVRVLADHVIARIYPGVKDDDAPYAALLDAVCARTADLIAAWMSVGFIHGVMNTDNMQLAGETIDYGPCAFMDHYDVGTVYSSIDEQGRYAYGNQPRIAQWNLARFAEALVPLLDADEARAIARAEEALKRFGAHFNTAYVSRMTKKLGLSRVEDGDEALLRGFLDVLGARRVDFTLAFRALSDVVSDDDEPLHEVVGDRAATDAWLKVYRARLAREPFSADVRADAMRRCNPAFIPRNHHVEAALARAVAGEMASFEALLDAVRAPYDDQPARDHLRAPPLPHEVVQATYCGT
jgi:uncharacterized protein YdiU (UPF0061 family)